METYLIVIGKTSTGYSAHCPDVLGCAAAGKSIEEVVANMRSALAFHFEGMAEDGAPIPKSRGTETYREVMSDAGIENEVLAHVPIDVRRFAITVS